MLSRLSGLASTVMQELSGDDRDDGDPVRESFTAVSVVLSQAGECGSLDCSENCFLLGTAVVSLCFCFPYLLSQHFCGTDHNP